jgi:hypothetical protein
MRSCIHACAHAYTHALMHTRMRSCIHACAHAYTSMHARTPKMHRQAEKHIAVASSRPRQACAHRRVHAKACVPGANHSSHRAPCHYPRCRVEISACCGTCGQCRKQAAAESKIPACTQCVCAYVCLSMCLCTYVHACICVFIYDGNYDT